MLSAEFIRFSPHPQIVIPRLGLGIHEFLSSRSKLVDARPSLGMTIEWRAASRRGLGLYSKPSKSAVER
jgi:hypothetical protein